MHDALEHGKIYYVPFIYPYTHKGPFHVKISAIAKKSTLNIYGDFDIRGTFFDEVGIKTYLTMVTDETDIYICHPIKSEDPPEIDEGTFIFIPKSIIDFSLTDEYTIMKRVGFNIEGTRRHFKNNYAYQEFIENIESKIKYLLSYESLLANDVLNVTNTQEEFLVRNSIVKHEEEERNEYIAVREKEKQLLDEAHYKREEAYLKKLSDINRREQIIIDKEQNIKLLTNDAQNRLIVANKWLSIIKLILKRIEAINEQVRRIGQEANIVNLLTWDEILNNIYDPKSLEIIEYNKWKHALMTYMNSKNKIETLPDELANQNIENDCNLCQRPF